MMGPLMSRPYMKTSVYRSGSSYTRTASYFSKFSDTDSTVYDLLYTLRSRRPDPSESSYEEDD